MPYGVYDRAVVRERTVPIYNDLVRDIGDDMASRTLYPRVSLIFQRFVLSPRSRGKEVIQEHLLEHIWRSQNQDALWNGFVTALKNVRYDGDIEDDEA